MFQKLGDAVMLIAILIATIVLNQPAFPLAPVGRLCQTPR